MYLTRPKSSKGRTRAPVTHSAHGEGVDCIKNLPLTPKPPVENNKTTRYLHSQSQSSIRQTSHQSQEEVIYAPTPRRPSLNKYKVLPSIERRQADENTVNSLESKTSKLTLSDNDIHQLRQWGPEPSLPSGMPQAATCSNPEIGNVVDMPCNAWPTPQDLNLSTTMEIQENKHSVDPQGSLLLAIRGPCGRRFQQSFAPTDTLLTVVGSAESRFGTRYSEAFLETMDVPRRTFRELSMTLEQCGILNRSVLCISQEINSVDYA